MSPDGGSVSWRLGGGRGVLEELTGLIILPCVSEYLEREGGRDREREGGERGKEGGREGGREGEGGRGGGRKGGRKGEGGREGEREGGREGGKERGSRYINTHTVYNSDYRNLSLH